MTCDASRILSSLQAAALDTHDPDTLGRSVVDALRAALPQASWIGIYWLEGAELVLGPYTGPSTEHTRIPVGTGVCGSAVAEDADRLVPDVRAIDNYLACSATVRSEMVALIRAHGQVVGQLDLDAEAVGAFDQDDLCVLRAVADGFGGLIGPRAPAPA